MKKLYQKILAGILCSMLFLSAVTVQAAQVNNGAVYSISTNEIAGWPQGPETIGEVAVLMDADTGAILYNKGMHELRYPASITKIMTCLLALEHCSLDEQVTFTETCLADQVAGSGNAGMKVGEVLTMKQCLLLTMVRSANDVATQVAEHVGGSVSAFVEMMNQRAKELGCLNTNFVNASGMPDDNHYSTAYDMALIFREAIKNSDFRDIIGTQGFTIEPTNMNSESRSYSTHHPLVALSAPEHYEGCFGGKTGVTDAAKNTLVSGAERDGRTLIAVAMRAEMGEVCYDHTVMFDYGFSNFTNIDVPGGKVTVPNGVDLSQLQVVETVDGNVTSRSYYYNTDYFVGSGQEEQIVEETPEENEQDQTDEELAQQAQEEQRLLDAQQKEEEQKATQAQYKQTYQYIIYILAGLVGVSFLCAIGAGIKKRKRKKKRKK